MSTNKNSYCFLLSLLGCFFFSACVNEITDKTEDELVEVSLNLSKKAIQIYDEPMTKAENKEFYHICAYNEISGDVHAYGTFDDINDLTISLNKTQKYAITVFLVYDYLTLHDFGTDKVTLDNKFTYNQSYPYGFKFPHTRGKDSGLHTPLMTNEAYSIQVAQINPAEKEELSIELKSASSAISIEVSGLAKGEKLEVILGGNKGEKFSDDKITFTFDKDGNTQSFITPYEILNHWKITTGKIEAVIPIKVNYIDANGKSTAIYTDEDCIFSVNKRKCFKFENTETFNTTITKEEIEFTNETVNYIQF